MNKRLMWHNCDALFMVEDVIDNNGNPQIRFRTRKGVYYTNCYRCGEELKLKDFSKVTDIPDMAEPYWGPVRNETVMRGEFHIEDL